MVHGHDLGRWLSPYGATSAPTPRLQKFADEGVLFERAFATAPLCSPARGSMFTGLLPHEHGLMGLVHHAWRYRDGVVTLPEYLAELGYCTALVGLQHENNDSSVLGFEEVLSGGFLPRALPTASMAAEWLVGKNNGDDDRPFLLTVGFWEAHRPWSDEDYDPVPPEQIDVPAYLPDNPETRGDIGSFLGAVRQLDQAFGVVIDALGVTRFAENTLVVFTTDHGAAFPRAKSTLYDAGVGVALIVAPPRDWNVSPSAHSQLVSHLDLVPTFIDAAGGMLPESLRGRSLLADVVGESYGSERSLFLEKTYHDDYDPLRAVRTSNYKYIRSFGPSAQPVVPLDIQGSRTYRSSSDWANLAHAQEELYDLTVDEHELHNLAGDDQLSQVKDNLSHELVEWMARTGDPLLDGQPALPPPRDRGIDALPRLDARRATGANGIDSGSAMTEPRKVVQ